MRISLIVAVSENGVIGRAGGLPWHLSNDLRYFKRVTMGKPVIMGRRTFDSIGRPLPGRTNIVVSGNPAFAPEGAEVVPDMDRAIARAATVAEETGAEEVVVIGGAAIYEAALPRADRIYLTEVHADVDGDARFPPVDMSAWREISRERHPAGDRDEYDHSFVVLERVESA